MRFFYVPKLKLYIFIPALLVFTASLLLRVLFRDLFFTELHFLEIVRNKLGYTTEITSYRDLIVLRLLLSMFYGFIAGVIGLLYFRVKYKNEGYTLLVTNNLKIISGLSYLLLIYCLLHTGLFNINTQVNINRPDFNLLSPQLSEQIRSFFIPKTFFNLPSYPAFTGNNNLPVSNTQNTYATQHQTPPVTNTNQTHVQPTAMRMPSAQELFSQLNLYRQQNGRSPLSWDTKLADYAQTRANVFAGMQNTDNHSGFDNYLRSGGHNALCFFGLGENSSYGMVNDAKSIIDWFGSQNQLNYSWSHVGIGLNGTAIDFVYGGGKMDQTNNEHLPPGC